MLTLKDFVNNDQKRKFHKYSSLKFPPSVFFGRESGSDIHVSYFPVPTVPWSFYETNLEPERVPILPFINTPLPTLKASQPICFLSSRGELWESGHFTNLGPSPTNIYSYIYSNIYSCTCPRLAVYRLYHV